MIAEEGQADRRGGSDEGVRKSAHFVFRFQPSSYAADHLPWLMGRAERAWRALSEFAGDNAPPPSPITVYLAPFLPDPDQPGAQVDRGAYADVKTGEIRAVCRAESPAEGLEEAIGHLVVFQPTAPGAGMVPFLRAGLVAFVLAEAGRRHLPGRRRAPPPESLHRVPREALERGEAVRILPRLVERSAINHRQDAGLALSFIGFLVEQYGVMALRTFLGRYDVQNPDRAAEVAFHKPLAALQEEWLRTVARSLGSRVSLVDFFRRLLPYLKPYPLRIALILGYMLFALAFSLGLQLSIKVLIDNVIGPPGNLGLLFQLLFLLLGAFVLNGLFSLHRAYLTAWVSQNMLLRLRLDLFKHLQRLSASFYGRARIGDIVSRLSNDLVVIQGALSEAALSGLFYALSFVSSAIALFLLNWRLATVAVLMLPLLFVSTKVLSGGVVRASRERSERLGDVTNVLSEALSAQAVVRAFGLQQRMVEQFRAELGRLFGSALRLVLLGSLFGLSSNLVTSLIQVLTLGTGAYLIIVEGSLTVGGLFAFFGLLGSVTSPVEQFTELLQALQQAAGSMQRVTQLLDEPVEVRDPPDATRLPRLQREIRFDHVWFSYTGERPALQDLSFAVPAGGFVAVVGPSGSGKSTVINLLLRFYDPQEGRILLDGVDIRAGTQASLREQMAIVFQDTFLFNTTIRENLAYGRLGATDEEIIAAARQAEIHDFIMSLSAGYDTVVGERGARLSGGQRQRLAIARALLRNPAILLLDEATSALDAETEAQIQATLARVRRGGEGSQPRLTTVAVTHRLASAAAADDIYVLDRGLLVEQGTHADLLAERGLYARLYAEQQGAAMAGVPPGDAASRLRRVPLFADLPAESLAAIAARLETERFAPGQTIVDQHEVGDKLYLVDRGQVEVTTHDGPAGKQQVNLLHEGDYFGELAFLRASPCPASVRAAGPVQVLTLSRACFGRLLERQPGLAQQLAPTIHGHLAKPQKVPGG